MKYKDYIIIGIVIVLIAICYIFGNVRELSDSEKFKKEYESLNGVVNTDNNKEYRKLNINKDNSIIYSSDSDIVDRINNNETFIVYFGFNKCPWCRSVLPSLLDVVKDMKVGPLYYVDVYDIRNTMEFVNNEVEETKRGSNSYYELLELLDGVLDEYTIKDNDSNEISANQKRIYAPNVVVVIDGVPYNMTTGIIDSLTDPYMEITDSMRKEIYNKFKCSFECLTEESTVCESKLC